MSKSRGVLFIVQHPAHVHQFKYLVWRLAELGHRPVVLAIDKDVTRALLEAYDIQYRLLSTTRSGLLRKLGDVLPQLASLRRVVTRDDIRCIVTRGNVAACLYSGASRVRHIVFADSEPVVIDRLLTRMADAVVTPAKFRGDFGARHHRINSYKELAYLHPKYHSPREAVLQQLGIQPGEPFFILRFVSWAANHDVGRHGLSRAEKLQLVKTLERRGRVFVTSERRLDAELERWRFALPPAWMHDALAFATMFVGDSQTMATEAAIVGTPAVRINSFVGEQDMANFHELEHDFGLLRNFRTLDAALPAIDELLAMPDLKVTWRSRAARLVRSKEDMNAAMLSLILEES